MTNRKLQALRNLAERPGTEAEGLLAREILDRYESGRHSDIPPAERPHWIAFEDYLRGKLTMAEFIESMARRVKWERDQPLPSTWVCDCGATVAIGAKCEAVLRHDVIRVQMPEKFPRGKVVYYNCWAYELNSQAVVIGYSKTAFNHIRLQFASLKNPRSVPVYQHGKCLLSYKPLSREDGLRLQNLHLKEDHDA